MNKVVFAGILSLVILSGCAAVSPYRVSNFFVDKEAVTQLRAQRVAVLPFQNSSGDYPAGIKVTDEFNLQLGKLNEFALVERIRIEDLYKEQDFDPNRIDQDTAVKIGKMLGAHGVILGNVIEYSKGKIGVSVRLVNVETGKQIWQARDTLYAGDRRVKVLVDGFWQKMRLKSDKEFLAQILCQLLAQTFVEK
ncbi:MAG: CsgG/HfaB family protein [bacterium]|nr:CsgG/HfaB family protein [bacterium]